MFDAFFFKNRYLILVVLAGLTLIGLGAFYARNGGDIESGKIEVLTASTEAQNKSLEIVVEISGEVEKPGVYRLGNGSRVEDLLIAAGGLSVNADRVWVEQNLNRAAKLSDGQKVFIPSKESITSSTSITGINAGGGGQNVLININTADAKTLDSLPGIGPAYAQSIVEHRPYSTAQELVSKGALNQSTYEKIKDKITAY